ncbi:sugar ABC transporter substrate-binding protein [Paracoccus sp. (in: a-proteobacteria)]|uniref:ABC transporter substrate-binding protein n=1 Tax=Paracoccus sp. TaxID=267 RepID=UPI0035B1D83C
MKTPRYALLLSGGLASFATMAWSETTLTIGTVNNSDMVVMQELSSGFEKANPDIKLKWVVMEENALRQALTTDISTNAGQYDIMTIGMFEAPIWGAKDWLVPFADVPVEYDLNDVFQSVRDGLSAKDQLFALPFYAESQLTFYRTDLVEAAGETMPEQPSWDDIERIASKIHKPDEGVYGICLRGKPGWGENMGQITPVANSYGARWFDMDWKPQFDQPQWKEALEKYVGLLRNYGPPGAAANGYNETLTLFANGQCGMWVDATVSAGFLTNPDQSTVFDKIGYALPPIGKFAKGNHYLWAWSLAIPKSSKNTEAAQKFIYWATSKDYIELVAEHSGWATVPPGTRQSTYDNPAYQEAAPFAKLTLETIQSADPTDATQEKVPYIGISFVGIPEFGAIGTTVGQEFAAVIAGDKSVDDALSAAQAATTKAMTEAGYIK